MLKDKNSITVAALLIATLLSFYCRIFFGWDQDQSYLTLLAAKLASGSIMFKDLWDLHQTSMIWAAMFSKVFWEVRGSWDGLGVYLRIISVAFQVAVAIWSYRELKKYFNEASAFLAAIVIANMLPRATQNLEYGAITVWLSLAAGLVIVDVNKTHKNELGKLLIAAFLYAISIFSYPTMLVSVPVFMWALLWDFKDYTKSKVRNLIVFFTTCAVVAIVIVAYLLKYLSFPELLGTLKAISNSGDHESMVGSFFSIGYWLKSTIRVAAFIALSFAGWVIVKYAFKKEIKVFYIFIGLVSLMIIFLNISGIRPSGPFGFLERYIGIVILGVCAGFKTSEEHIIRFLLWLGIAYYFGSLIGSNMGLNENAMYLELAVVGVIIAASESLKWNSKDDVFEKSVILLFVISVVFASGYFIRINYTSPANVFQCSERFTEGPAAGIFVMKEQMDEIKAKVDAIEHISEDGEVYALITNDSIYNFYLKGTTSAAGYAPTSNRNYNELWINYYDEFGHVKPDVILVNTYWYPELEQFYSEIFGQWVMQRYKYEPTDYEKEFWKLVYVGS